MANETSRPKRFYASVSVAEAEGGFRVELDGRPIKGNDRQVLVIPGEGLARAVGEEWDAQETHIDLQSMPLTRLAQRAAVLDEPERARLIGDVLGYLGSDLLCFRVSDPDGLVVRQTAGWQPWLDWFEARYGAGLTITTGLDVPEQPATAHNAVRAHVEELGAFELCALSPATALMGSVVLALALLEGAASPDTLFEASVLDELWQAEQWGEDAEAAQRRALLRKDLLALGQFIQLVSVDKAEDRGGATG